MDTSNNNPPTGDELEEGRFLKNQFSLRLLCWQTLYFGICFGLIKSYINPIYLEPLKEFDTALYYSGCLLVFGGIASLYFGLLWGRNNIVENPRGWWKDQRCSLTIMGITLAIIAATGSILLQICIL